MRHIIIILFLLLCSGFGTFAQTQEYLFSHIGEKDGLSEQNINSIQQDKRGFIWIATHNALQRYDGQRFLTFRSKKNQPKAIPEAGIRSLLIDTKNRLWLITGNTRVGYFDVNSFVFHEVTINYPKDILKKSDAALYLDADGNLMLILVRTAILTYNEETGEIAEQHNKIKLPVNWKVNHLWQHADSRIFWIGCDSGLVKYNTVTKKLSYRGHNEENDAYISQFANAKSIVNTYMDNTKRLWITYWPLEGMHIKTFRPGEPESVNWRDKITASLKGHYFELHGVTELKDGSIWLAGHNLLAKFNEQAGSIDIIKNNEPGEFSIRYDRIKQLLEDNEKNIWIATDKSLFRINPSAQVFKPIRNRVPGSDNLYTADVTDIIETQNGEILVSTWGNGVFSYDKYFNPIHSRIISRKHPEDGSMIWSMTQRKNGDIWGGAQGGYLYIFHPSTGRSEKILLPETENSTIRQVTEDKTGNIWLGTQRGFIIKWDVATKKFTVLHKFQTIITRIYVDDRNDIWVCTLNAGLHRFISDGKLMRSYTSDGSENSLTTNGCADIIQYNDSLYCISSDALNILNIKTGRVMEMGMDEGLTSTKITNLVKDKMGNVWMTCASGVACFNPLTGKLSSFNSADGVHTNDFSLSSNAVLKDNRIVFGTNHDLLVFTPETSNPVHDYPKVEITGISIHNVFVNTDSVMNLPLLKLSYHQNSLAFQFSTLTFQNLFTIHYKLENIDKDWKMADRSKMAVYSYLPPGEYLFQVACKKNDGTFGDITTIKIRISAPFWKTWWFYGALIVGSLLIVYWLDKQRTQRRKREQDIRSSIADNLHHQVNTTLQNINVLSEIAGIKADKDPEQSKDYIHEIKQKSRNMVTALNDVLWSIDPANDSMEKTISRIKELTEALEHTYNTTIGVHIENNVSNLNLDMKKRHEFITIYKLGVTSLVQEMMANHTTVHLDFVKGMLNLKIYSRVNGNYRANNTVIKNIHEMKERAASVNAILDIQNDDRHINILLSLKIG